MIDQEEIADLRQLIRERNDIEHEILKLSRQVFAVGETVHFYRGRGWIDAIIMQHGGTHKHPSFKIKNLDTEREYRIDLFWLTWKIKT